MTDLDLTDKEIIADLLEENAALRRALVAADEYIAALNRAKQRADVVPWACCAVLLVAVAALWIWR